jgi:hypothetical protein
MEVILMRKRLLAILVCLALCVSLLPVSAFAAARDTSFEETMAVSLKEMGLFKGVSDTDFDLNREPTRVEALVMLVRLLDAEETALEGNWEHPFTDVPAWADKYVGYAYENGLTNGTSATTFGEDNANAAMYVTFVLRALGYSDTDGEDFTWDDPFTLAEEIGIIPDCVDLDNFWRADVVSVSYAALAAEVKDGDTILAKKLWGSSMSNKYYRYYDTNTFRTHENGYETLVNFVQSVSSGSTDSNGNVYYMTAYGDNLYLEYMPSRTYVSIDYVTDDAFLLIQLNNDGTIEYAYVYTLDENDNKVSVYGEIFPEKYLEVGNESVTQRSDGSAWYESERRTLLVVLPDGTKTTDLTYVPTFGNMAYSAINDALICLRASLKDAGLPIDLTDFGFTNTQTIGSVERSLDLYA